MTIIQAIVLAIVEGLTEFLPVSSTGHMILAQGIMQMQSDEYLRAFTVMIQFGAILSVIVLYWKRFFSPKAAPNAVFRGKKLENKWQRWGFFYLTLVVGILPAAVIGLLFEQYIDLLLSKVSVVAVMLLLGGVFMLFIDRIFSSEGEDHPTLLKAFFIGCYQVIAMIPGVSRSMATIVGGMQQGLSRKAAAKYSFFLAVPTMLGATLLKAYKLFKSGGVEIFRNNATTLLLGNLVAFVVAMLAIRFFISYLTKYGFKLFGYYRIVVGSLILLLMALNVPLTM